jgi:tRNA nucleotidyltransferase (CCA-adding enzyme)
LVKVATADKGGRPPLPWKFPLPEGEWLLARAEELAVKDSIPKAILQGKHLLKIGHQPGPQLGQILKAAYEAQLDGKFKDVEGGLEWIRDRDS